MNAKDISFIIPIFNRPEEAKELLESFAALDGDKDFEIVVQHIALQFVAQ